MGLATFLNGESPTRGLMWLALSDTAIVQTRQVTSDGGGGGTASWVAAGTFPCRIAPLSSRPTEKLTGGQIDERATHVVTVPPTVVLSESDRVAVSNHGTFEVTGIKHRTSQITQVFEVIQVL